MTTSVDATGRRQLLPWRPRIRLVWFWNRGLARLYKLQGATQNWFDRRFRGKLLVIGLPLFLFVNFCIVILGVALVAEITIIPFAVSLELAYGEWLLLVLLCPIVWLVRLVSPNPWPRIPRQRSRRVIWP